MYGRWYVGRRLYVGRRAGVEAIRARGERRHPLVTHRPVGSVCALCVCCAHVVDEVHESAARGRGCVRPAELGRGARRDGEQVRLLGAMLGQAVLRGAGLRGTALGRCPGAGVSVSEVAAQGVPLVAAQH
eukprot:scaffold49582_cov75-Phaeocystis_antarctica.AAC.2